MPLLTWLKQEVYRAKNCFDEVVEMSVCCVLQLRDPNIWSLEALMYREFDLVNLLQ